MQNELALCEMCGEPMPSGETMFKYHGYSGPCPEPTAAPKQDEIQESGGVIPTPLILRYDECGEVFWVNPWSQKEERIFMMMWPSHPPEETSKVEGWWKLMGEVMVGKYNELQRAVTSFHELAEMPDEPTPSADDAVGNIMPDCMMPDGADPCPGWKNLDRAYEEQFNKIESLTRERDRMRAVLQDIAKHLDGIKYDLDASVYTVIDDEFETVFYCRDLADQAIGEKL